MNALILLTARAAQVAWAHPFLILFSLTALVIFLLGHI
jgi:hypothetical protein